MDWPSLPISQLFNHFETGLGGLGQQDRARRLKRDGLNKIRPPLPDPLGGARRGAPILASRLFSMATTLATSEVRVGGRWIAVKSDSLVTGDVVRLEAGDRAVADLRVLQVIQELRIDLASVTGEIGFLPRNTMEAPQGVLLEVAENVVPSGAFVTHGSFVGVVCATGSRTLLSRIRSRSAMLRGSQRQFRISQKAMCTSEPALVFRNASAIASCQNIELALLDVRSMRCSDGSFDGHIASHLGAIGCPVVVFFIAVPSGLGLKPSETAPSHVVFDPLITQAAIMPTAQHLAWMLGLEPKHCPLIDAMQADDAGGEPVSMRHLPLISAADLPYTTGDLDEDLPDITAWGPLEHLLRRRPYSLVYGTERMLSRVKGVLLSPGDAMALCTCHCNDDYLPSGMASVSIALPGSPWRVVDHCSALVSSWGDGFGRPFPVIDIPPVVIKSSTPVPDEESDDDELSLAIAISLSEGSKELAEPRSVIDREPGSAAAAGAVMIAAGVASAQSRHRVVPVESCTQISVVVEPPGAWPSPSDLREQVASVARVLMKSEPNVVASPLAAVVAGLGVVREHNVRRNECVCS